MNKEPGVFGLDRRAIRAHFERAAQSYDSASVLQAEVAGRLLERLDMLQVSPGKVLDLGAGTGLVTTDVLARYPKSVVVALDVALNMLLQLRRGRRWQRQAFRVGADAASMPFADHAFDLVLSNLMLQWCQPPDGVFGEISRILSPEGAVMFATLGPDTLHELRDSWSQVDQAQHVNVFMDMHDIGDAMLRAGLRDPVVDVDRITLTYSEVPDLLRDLKALGATNAASGRTPGLGGRERLSAMIRAYEDYRREDGLIPATYEVIYGHAWGRGEARQTTLPSGEVVIPINQFLR